MALPIPTSYAPMDARLIDDIPDDSIWQYEPKWDGFRCLAFRDGSKVELQSKSGQPLGRYFPEIVASLEKLSAKKFVLDSELVIPEGNALSFDALLQRIHPAASRIKKLSVETPAVMICFDLLVDSEGAMLADEPLRERRKKLEQFSRRFLANNERIVLSPATGDVKVARRWFAGVGAVLDGVIAKRLDLPYQSGKREGMVKVKKIRTADCVVGGFRYASKGHEVGSLLLGLYNAEGLLDHVGFCSSFKTDERKKLRPILEPLIEAPGFTGQAPGGPSRWSTERSTEWQPLAPKLVVEVQYDHFSGGRFRHGTKFLRWRPDKSPKKCTIDQVRQEASVSPLALGRAHSRKAAG
ncbi:MAG TPA: ATP-dependent DNA ligase [Tepidisphaeraceae bacterium]|nr:ATP-dependent DNA ligase [Tepidisphaeraceae bacterium]